MPDPRRTYGYGDSTPFIRGAPRVMGQASMGVPCPECGCTTLYDIEVDVRHPLLRGPDGAGIGRYVGCPACPFASPMLMVATSTNK